MAYVLNSFWLELLECIFVPIFNFIPYDPILCFVLLVLFTGVQVWLFYHFVVKPLVWFVRLIISIIPGNKLWGREIEKGEKTK